MELRVLRYFLAVAKEQSFTRAAEQLHITQPTLSRQLAALEEELGSVLFNRSGRNITLTEEGLLLKRRALEIIDLQEKIIDEFKGNEEEVEGVMAIHGLGYPVSIQGAIRYWREDLLVQRKLYPEVKANTIMAWRRNLPQSKAIRLFIDEINAFQA